MRYETTHSLVIWRVTLFLLLMCPWTRREEAFGGELLIIVQPWAHACCIPLTQFSRIERSAKVHRKAHKRWAAIIEIILETGQARSLEPLKQETSISAPIIHFHNVLIALCKLLCKAFTCVGKK